MYAELLCVHCEVSFMKVKIVWMFNAIEKSYRYRWIYNYIQPSFCKTVPLSIQNIDNYYGNIFLSALNRRFVNDIFQLAKFL